MLSLLKTLTYSLILNTFLISSASSALKDTAFLGMKLTDLDYASVRTQLLGVGGFKQDRTTTQLRNVDKFFTSYNLRDSYYIEFRYNDAGNVVSVKRLYRPNSILNANKRTPIDTRDVAFSIIDQAGQPTQVLRKGWGGSPTYSAYIWKDEDLTIIVDREGSELYGNVFVEYIVNKQDPYFVEPKFKRP